MHLHFVGCVVLTWPTTVSKKKNAIDELAKIEKKFKIFREK